MVQAVAGEQALKARRIVKSTGTGEEHWRTDFLGTRSDGELKRDQPQAFLIEMGANEIIVPHFHEVDQFQVFVSGAGSLGRNQEAAAPLSVHYADHHTGYGPINAGPHGYSYFTLRAMSDSGAVYLHKTGYREKLKPSRKRHGTASGLALSTEPVLMASREVRVQPLLRELEGDDGLSAALIRMGPAMTHAGPDPRATGGQYYLVLNGSLELDGTSYSAWSLVFVGASESPLALHAGLKGLEALLVQFPKSDSVIKSR